MPRPGIEPATLFFPARLSNHSAIGTVSNKVLELLQYFDTIRYYKNSVVCAKDI